MFQQKESEFELMKATLQKQMEEGWSKSSQLEAAVFMCKDEITSYVNKLKECKERHELETVSKTHEILKLEKQLQHVVNEMDEKASLTGSLEKMLEERQKMLQESNCRITELEEKEGQLQQQVSYFEREITKLRSVALEESQDIQKKLHHSNQLLEEKKKQLEEMSRDNSKGKSDLHHLKKTNKTLEKEVQSLQKIRDGLDGQIVNLKGQLETCQAALQQQKTKVLNLEAALKDKETQVSDAQVHYSELDVELNRAQGQLKEASRQLTDLQQLLQKSRSEVKEKNILISKIEEELRISQREAQSKDQDLKEMEAVLQSSRAQLEERTKQVTQFDHVVREQQETVGQRVQDLEIQLQEGEIKQQRQLEQISGLEQKCFEQVQELQRQCFHKQTVEANLEAKGREVDERNKRINSLEQEIKNLQAHSSERKNGDSEKEEELRWLQEELQKLNSENAELKTQLSNSHAELDRITQHLEELTRICQSKDAECTRLAEKLGEAKAREVTVHSQLTSEMNKVTQQQHMELEQKEEELADIQRDHFQLLTLKDQQQAELDYLRDSEPRLKTQVQSLQDAVTNLQRQLSMKEEKIQAANEIAVIKEAECARLSAQISGYERAMYSKKADFSPLSKSSSTFSPLTKVTSNLSSPVQSLPQETKSFHQFSLLQSLSELTLPKERYITSHPLDLTVKGLYAPHQAILSPQRNDHIKPSSVLKSQVNLSEQESHGGRETLREFPKESLVITNQFQEAPSGFDGVGTPSFQEMLAYVNRRIKEDELEPSHSLGRTDTDIPDRNVKVCDQKQEGCTPWNNSGGDNTMPFISALLANSEEETGSANKIGSRFPRGIESPSSQSAGSNQDDERLRHQSIPSKSREAKSSKLTQQRSRKIYSSSQGKSVSRSLFNSSNQSQCKSSGLKKSGKTAKK